MKRTPPPGDRRATTPPRPSTPDPVTPATRRTVRARSGGRCEARVSDRCTGVACHVHHRKLRRHGDHTPDNLLDVCLFCHDEIHHNVSWSYDYGFLVRAHDDPGSIPVRLVA